MGSLGVDKAMGVLVIEQSCENDQLLVSICRNDSQWLSPVGWKDQQKVTLLDCRSAQGKTEISIPEPFAKDIQAGDTLILRCSELDLEQEIVWTEADSLREVVETSSPAILQNGGLFSRFKAAKAEPILEQKSEAERRADDADRAAQNFKAKMEAATAAKEEAQRKALEAARQAEAALKMEADRIAEMERAAKAFEEAERLKQDEMRRVEEERRAEEERLAEEARRIEAARKREIEAKIAAERKAALERYETALDMTHNEEARLKDRLERLKSDAAELEERNFAQVSKLATLRKDLIKTETTVETRRSVYEKNNAKLEKANAELLETQEQVQIRETDSQAIAARLLQADTDYHQAQKDAEDAIARAEHKRLELEAIFAEESDVKERIQNLSTAVDVKREAFSDITVKTQKLQSKFEKAQADLNQTTLDIATLEQDQLANADADQSLRLEIEATQQAIEDTQDREVHHRKAIAHLEAGGDPVEVTDIVFDPSKYNSAASQGGIETAGNFTYAGEDDAGFADRILGRVRSTFAREKDPEISIDIDDKPLEDFDSVLLAGVETSPGFIRRHGTSLMAVGAVMGGLAILGGGYAINQSVSKPNLQVKSSQPVPNQVASAVVKIEAPAMPLPDEPAAIAERVEPEAIKADVLEAEITPLNPLPKKEASAEVHKDNFAFELPDMMPKAVPEKTNIPAPRKKTSDEAKSGDVKIETVKKAELTTPASVEDKFIPLPETVETEAETLKYYPEVTKDIQTRLANLGLYSGAVDGDMGAETTEAIETFRVLFSNAALERTQANLLNELQRVQHEQNKSQPLQPKNPTQLASVKPSNVVYDILPAVPSLPVDVEVLEIVTETPDIFEPVTTPITEAPVINDTAISEPVIVKEASAPVKVEVAPTPVIEDVIVPAKLLKNAGASYPRKAEQRGYFVDVAIIVAYDIDAEGKVTNMSITSNDHSGRFNESFEKEAMKAVKKLKFAPKTVNGEAVVTTGNMKRIVFRAE